MVTLDRLEKKVDEIAQAQSALLAALNELGNEKPLEDRLDALNGKLNHVRGDTQFLKGFLVRMAEDMKPKLGDLNGKLEGIRTELAASIGNAFLNFEAKVKKAASRRAKGSASDE